MSVVIIVKQSLVKEKKIIIKRLNYLTDSDVHARSGIDREFGFGIVVSIPRYLFLSRSLSTSDIVGK